MPEEKVSVQEKQENEVVLDGGKTSIGKDKLPPKKLIFRFLVVLSLIVGCVSLLTSCSKEDCDSIVERLKKDPIPPFTITNRSSFFESKGTVIQMHNTGTGHSLKCWVQPIGSDGKLGPRIGFVIPPLEKKEVGWVELDDWALKVGDTVKITFENNNRVMKIEIKNNAIYYGWD